MASLLPNARHARHAPYAPYGPAGHARQGLYPQRRWSAGTGVWARTTGAREDSRNLAWSRGVAIRGGKDLQQLQQLQNQRSPGLDGLDDSKNGVFALLLINFGVHIAATSFLPGLPSMLALSHLAPAWWQFITAAFVHANWDHLFGNAFSLLVFGRMVEEEEGAFGLWVTYLVCGVAGNMASYLSSPHSATVSLGASSAVFGLFAVGVLTKVRLDLRRMLEALVLGAVRAVGRLADLPWSRVFDGHAIPWDSLCVLFDSRLTRRSLALLCSTSGGR